MEQDARIRLWKALEGEIRVEAPASFLYRVAVTAALDALRRSRTRKEHVLVGDMAPEDDAHQVPDAAENAQAACERRDLQRGVRGGLAHLSEPRRRAVALHLQGFTVPEIAGLLGWSRSRARNLAHRGLKELQRLLRAEGIEP